VCGFEEKLIVLLSPDNYFQGWMYWNFGFPSLCYLLLELGISIAILKGTVNDPTTFPPPSRSHGFHHWAFERLLSANLVPQPLTAAAFVTSGSNYPVVDVILFLGLVDIGVCSRF
jgi:hypothetical protein